MMPSQNTAGILIGGALLVLLAVVTILKGLANSISEFFHNLGMPAQFAADINSMVFFGGLFLLIILVVKAIPRLSRV